VSSLAQISELPAYHPPELPTKWDIIPIHASDRGAFKRCRQYWDWSSPSRSNLVQRADLLGIKPELWFGTGIHYCLEQHYNPGLMRDPVETWKTWFQIQWRGGVVTVDWLDKVYDLNPRQVSAPMSGTPALEISTGTQVPMLWQVRGLEDILPDADGDEFDELYQLGLNMMMFYSEYAQKADRSFRVLMVEHDFSIPVWDYANNRILTAIDLREDSPNYGNRLEVHARGRMDAIKVNLENSRLGIMDHKTAAAIGDDYFDKLETDEQCTSYLHAAQVEANYYGLPWKGSPMEEVLYNVLRKAYPKPPTELKNGMFSIDRQNESTTYEMLMAWIARNAPGVPLSDKQQAYVDYLREVGDEQFIVRRHVRRSQNWLASAGERLYLEALDMLDPNVRIYPNMTNDWLCKGCQFRSPCLAKQDRADYQQLIRDNYHSNRDR